MSDGRERRAAAIAPLVFGSDTAVGLRTRAARVAALLRRHPDHDLGELARGLAADVPAGEHRAVALGAEPSSAAEALEAFARGEPTAAVLTGAPAPAHDRGPVFVFSGHGSQWTGMAVELLDASEVMAEEVRRCEDALAPHVGFSVQGVLRGRPGEPGLDRVDVVQPVLFAAMVGLAAVWRAAGVVPSAVVGHSQGEVAAAHVAGALSLPDAARVVALRARALAALSGRGGMVAVSLSVEETRRRIAGHAGALEIAAINAPEMTAVSGAPDALETFLAACEEEGVRARRVRIDYAAHSSQVDAIRDELVAALAPIAPRAADLPLCSTVTGALIDTTSLGAEHWFEGERAPVRLDAAIRGLLDDGHRAFVEVGPHPVLTGGIQATVDAVEADPGRVAVLGTLRRDQGTEGRMLRSLAELAVRGGRVDWTAVLGGSAAEPLVLPEAEAPADGAARLQDLSLTRRRLRVHDLVVAEVRFALGADAGAALDPRRSFRELGLDSAAALEVRERIVAATGLPLPATLLFDQPDVRSVVDAVLAVVSGEERPATLPARRPRTEEPIAIVGVGCRFPGGVRSADDLWELIVAERDAIGPFPTDRGWDLERLHDPTGERAGSTYVRAGGFIHDAGDFDPEHFSISPREALAMDPHQRLLLECAWEALEDAGIDPTGLRGSATGVFAGVYGLDYGPRLHEGDDRVAGYGLTGTLPAVVSGRVAYALGLEGPAVSVDTACSASLVSLHLACQSLRQGETTLALAGGATVMSSPGIFVDFARQRGLSPDGRCRAYGAGADGTGFSEGVGVLALERLSEAERRGHRVLAVVRGSAINQDGASNGLTAPSGPSQERVIGQALANAGLEVDDVDAVEGHGTGTAVGDPIEAGAILATYGRRSGGPLWLGSLKSNVGHTQAAAGVGGVIKMVMALRRGVLPRTLGADEPSPRVDWDAGEVRPLSRAIPWPDRGRPRRAGVSSFGISGTNAHLLLEQAPAPAPAADRRRAQPATGRPARLPFLVSASGDRGLAAQAGRLRALTADRPELDPFDVAGSLATRRAHLAHRAVVLAGSAAELDDALGALEREEEATEGAVRGVVRRPPRVGFVFPGQGGQWTGMAATLLDESPAFAASMTACSRAIAPHVDFDLLGVVRGEPGQPTLDPIEVVQPVLFAIMVSLAATWRAFGVVPEAVVGHSQGEIAAAHVAGALSLEDAARIVCVRSRALARLEGGGGMLAVALSAEAFEQRTSGYDDRITIAAINGPTSLVVSAAPEVLDALERDLEADGVRARRIASTVPGHSPAVEVTREAVLSALADVAPQAGDVPLYSTVTGGLLATDAMGAEHWFRNLRQTVRFEPAVRELARSGFDTLIEIGPHPVLTAPALEVLESEGDPGAAAALGTLRRDDGGLDRVVAAVAEAHCLGVPVDWSRPFAGSAPVDLPTYAFQRRPFWLAAGAGTQDAAALGQSGTTHPLLAARVSVAEDGTTLFTGRLSLESHPWLADHAALGTTLVPGTALVELALHVGAETGAPVLEELALAAPLVLGEDDAVSLQVAVAAADEHGRRRVSVHSRAEHDPDAAWTDHAGGALVAGSGPDRAPAWEPAGEEVEPATAYARLADAGYEYGPVFRGLRRLVRDGGTTWAEVALDDESAARAGAYGVHPALADAALHAAMFAGLEDDETRPTEIPFAFSGVRLAARGATRLLVRVLRDGRAWRIDATDAEHHPVLAVEGLETRPLDASRLTAQRGDRDALYEIGWQPLPPSAAGASPRIGLLGALPVAEGAGHPVFADLAAVEAAADEGEAPAQVLVEVGRSEGPLAEAAGAATGRALALLRDWAASDALAGSRLVVVTRGAVAVEPGERPELTQAAVPGLVRSAASEHPGRFALLDVAGGALDDALLDAALSGQEPEVAVREDRLLVPRLRHHADRDLLVPAPEDRTWHVGVDAPGTLESLRLAEHPRASTSLGPLDVRVAVHAAGLNFRDVGVTLGLLDGGTEMQIGFEGAGLVVEVGEAVDDLGPGDRVLGLIPHAFGPTGVADRRHLAPLPDGWSYVQGAAVPLVFLTAWYGLVELGRLTAGQAVLVHGAAGGVGMAALQIARHVGAEAFATAHPRKWHVLRGLGVDDAHVASSRGAGFEAAFADATHGDGVDLVLNSLTGPLLDASLRLLPKGGRFVEMGKTDVRDPAAVAAEHPGVAYEAFDLREVPPERIAAMLETIVELFERGTFTHLPVTTWDVREAAAAFRVVRDSAHVGKLVLRVPQPARTDGTVLVTGGTGGLGALVARHLAERREAGRLLLASRRGAEAPGALELVEDLRALDVEVELVACDVGDRDAVRRLLDRVPADRPLTGVVHAAGALDDGVLAALDDARLAAVLHPKLDAAAHLHELTRDLDLERFLLFSSAVATVGSPGQANYAAANAFLDALAAARRADGLPGLALGFGLWERVTGMSEHLADGAAPRSGSLDALPLPDELGLRLIDAAERTARSHLVPMLLDRARLRARAQSGLLRPVLRDLVRDVARPTSAASPSERTLAAVPEAEREELALGLVRAHAAAVLGRSGSQDVDPDRPFKELGADSLSAVELRNRIARASGLTLPATLVFDHPTPAAVARLLLDRVGTDPGPPPAAAPTPAWTPTARADHDDPIAVVGVGCRFPGDVRSAEDLWELVAEGRDAIGEFPVDRGWDLDRLVDPSGERSGTSYVQRGGFLHDAAEFDAEHFSISPREALAMDPQQRVLLECAWEALEDAGLDPRGLQGADAGVFVGAYASGYGVGSDPPDEVLGLRLTGEVTSVISGRVAYAFGLSGPAVTVDTACSSSLVSLHLACRALRDGECTMALAGGVSVLVTPMPFVEFSRQQGLSRDGRCRAYGAGARGTGFSDGAGVVVLEPLSVARERGHRVLGLVRSSATNQDGASNGLAAPSGPAQERVIEQALARAGLGVDDVDAVEGHGTGTELGDPIEAGALLATYGRGRSGDPLWLGSLKSNVGHTQAAAGVGGVIKVLMAMRHGVLPPTLHAEEPSPHVDWASGDLRLLTETTAWPRRERPRRAGVSSFGISGTNAHVILEEAPAVASPPAVEPALRTDVVAVPVSGSSAAALVAQAGRMRDLVSRAEEVDVRSIAAAAVRRARLPHRAVLLASDPDQLRERLAAVEADVPADGVLRAVTRGSSRAGFVFPGQGGQWPGMGRALREQSDVFARAMDECARAIGAQVDFDLLGVLDGAPGQPSMERIDVVQPALFAIMVSLAALWRSFGVEPAAVVGHSQGEIAAAHVAGGLSLEDAARIVCVRSRALARIEGAGGMLAVALPAEEFASRTRALDGRVAVAAENGPASVVASGAPDVLDALQRDLEADGVRARRIASTVAGHSPAVEAVREELLEGLDGLAPRPGEVPLFSTVTGERLATEAMDAEHWYRNLRQTVRFAPAMRAFARAGVGTAIEVGPHPVLAAPALEVLEAERPGAAVAAVGTLRRDEGDAARFVAAAAEAQLHGVPVDWSPSLAGAQPAALPTYAFQRRRYWLAPRVGGPGADGVGQAPAGHPLLSATTPLAGGGAVFTGRLGLEEQPWLADRALLGVALVPGAVFVELALHAAEHTGAASVEELALAAPLQLEAGRPVVVQLAVSGPGPGPGGGGRITVHSRPADAAPDAPWTEHAAGTLAAPGSGGAPTTRDGVAWPEGAEDVDPEVVYDRLAEVGLEHGPAFRGLRRMARTAEAVAADVELDDEQAATAHRFGLHPALLDAALRAADALAGADVGDPPVQAAVWHGVRLHVAGARHARARAGADGGLVVGDENGPILTVERVELRPLAPDAVSPGAGTVPGSLLRTTWPVMEGRSSDDGTEADVLDLTAPRPADAAGVRGTLTEALAAVRAALRSGPGARTIVVTRGAVAALPGETVSDLAAAPTWGLVRSAQAEHPGRLTLVDVDDDPASLAAARSAAATGEPQLAVRAGALHVPRLERLVPAASPVAEDDWPGTVLVTGGTSGLGAVLARHLVAAHGVRRLLLLSRRGPAAPGVDDLRRDLVGLGASVAVVACDAADRDHLRSVVDATSEHPITGVVHAAGVADNATVEALTDAQLETVLRPKVDAALNLDALTREHDLRAFVLCSSAAATFGGPGQGNYAAANVLLDALALRRRADGLAGTSIAWGLLEQSIGNSRWLESDDAGQLLRHMAGTSALRPLTVEQALGSFDQALAGEDACVVATPLDRVVLAAELAAGTAPSVLSGIVRPRHAPRARASAPPPPVATEPADVGEAVRAEVAAGLGYAAPEALDMDVSFVELGVDSLVGLELRNRLRGATGVDLPSSIVFDVPTPAALVAHIEAELGVEPSGGRQAASAGARDGGAALLSLFRRAHHVGRLDDGVALVEAASRLRPRFGLSHAEHEAPEVVVLGRGGSGPLLVCVPSVIATGGVHEFTRFARALDGRRDVVGLANPGFREPEPLPSTVEAAAAAQAESIARHAEGRPVVVVGFSTGGLLAHAIAAQLERDDAPTAGVVLLDSHAADTMLDLLDPVVDRMLAGGRAQPSPGDDGLTAMVAYFRMLETWRPRGPVVPTLLVTAGRPLGGAPAATWSHRTAVVEVDADHLTLLEEDVETTAEAVEAWIEALPTTRPGRLARVLRRG